MKLSCKSAFDMVAIARSGAIIWATSHTSRHKDKHRFPIGKVRDVGLMRIVHGSVGNWRGQQQPFSCVCVHMFF